MVVRRAAAAVPTESDFPFWCLMFFTFVLFVAPQSLVPALEPLHLGKFSALLAIGAYVLDRQSRGRPLTVMVRPVRLILWFVVLAVLSVPFSRWPGGSVALLTNEFGKSVTIFFLLANTVGSLRRMQLMAASMALWGVVMAVTAITAFASGDLALQGVRIAGYDSPLAANPNDLALTLNIVLALALGLYWGARKAGARAALLAAMGLSAGAIVVSFSRGGFLTLAAVGVVVMIKEVRERGPVALAPLALLPILNALLPLGYGDRIYSIFDFGYDASGSATARSEGMRLSFNIMLENPVVGVGLGQDVLAWIEKGAGWGETHNAFLQVAVELGIPAFIIYLLLIWEVHKGVRQAQQHLGRLRGTGQLIALGKGIEVAIVAFVVGAFFAPVPYHFYFYYVAGFAVAYHEMAKRVVARAHAVQVPSTNGRP